MVSHRFHGDDRMKKKQKSTTSGIDFTIDETGAIGLLKIKGALTEQQVEKIHEQLENLEPNVSYFKINFENVTAVDIKGVQALFSTHEKLGKSNKTMVMDGLCPVTFTSAVENMGLSNHRWLCFGQL